MMERLSSEAEDLYKEKRIKELVKKFGEEIQKIEGFIDFLLEQKDEIVSVDANPANKIAVYIIDKHYLNKDSTNVRSGMASVVGVYQGEKKREHISIYKDLHDEKKNDPSLEFGRVKIVEIKEDRVKIRLTPKDENYTQSEYEF